VLWLGLEGALGAFSAALAASDGSRAPLTATADGNDALERGLFAVDEVLAGTRLDQLAGIAVGLGPGRFTGLRIALSYAKSLAFATSLPLVGVSSYDVLEPREAVMPHATFVHGRAGVVCVRLTTKSGISTFCGDYDAVADRLAERLGPGSQLVSFGATEGVAPALGERGLIVQAVHNEVDEVDVPALAVLRRAMTNAAAGNAHAIRADYGEAHYAERTHDEARGVS
jgi:tRNA threonylcarbamoyl adenosine modification protein YeaZ